MLLMEKRSKDDEVIAMAETPNPVIPQRFADNCTCRLITADKSFFCFSDENRVRRLATRLVNWKWFERICLIVIVCNCLSMSIYSPCDESISPLFRTCLHVFDLAVSAFFIFEMLVKMLSQCAVGHSNAYLANVWNRLDFVIVVASFVDFINLERIEDLKGSDWRMIRAIRILRPLRAVKRIPGLRLLVALLFEALPALSTIIAMMMFVYFIFGIIGVQLWAGDLRKRCFLSQPSDFPNLSSPNLPPFYQSPSIDAFACGGFLQCSDVIAFEARASMCKNLFLEDQEAFELCNQIISNYSTCQHSDFNPFNGGVSFDNIGIAFITIFQAVSPEGWSAIMYLVQDAYSFWAWPYFVFLIVVTTFGVSNLSFIVIATQIPETKRRLAIKMKEEAQAKVKPVHNWLTAIIKEVPMLAPGLNLERLSLLRARESTKTISDKDGRNFYTIVVDLVVDTLHKPNHGQGQDPKWTSCVKLNRSREFLKRILQHPSCEIFMAVAILLSTVSMAVEHHGQPEWLTVTVDWLNVVFTALFTIELLISVYAYGFVAYIRNAFNMLDFVIVVFSLAELLHQGIVHTSGSSSGLIALRTFRLLRVLKLLRFSPALQRQLVTMFRTIDAVAPFLLLFGLFVFIFSVLGMLLFGCDTTKEASNATLVANDTMRSYSVCDIHRQQNFASLLSSFLTVLRVLTQDDGWSQVLRDTMFCSGSYWPAVYFIGLLLIGNCVIMSMLLAIVDVGSTPVATKFIKEMAGHMAVGGSSLLSVAASWRSSCAVTTENRNYGKVMSLRRHSYSYAVKRNPVVMTRSNSQESCDRLSMFSYRLAIELDPVTTPMLSRLESNKNGTAQKNEKKLLEGISIPSSCSFQTEMSNKAGLTAQVSSQKDRDYSLFLFHRDNPFRKCLNRIVSSRCYDRIMLIVVFANCLAVTFERPSIDPSGLERTCLDIANYVFSSIFLVEAIAKIIAFGFVIGPKAYLRNGWNILDFVLVVLSIVDFTVDLLIPFANLQNIALLRTVKALRLLRTFKPLRAISRTVGLKVVIRMTAELGKSFGHAMLIACIFVLAFSVLGLHLFRGCFYHCKIGTTGNATTKHEREQLELQKVRTRQECLFIPGLEWQNEEYNFDNFLESLKSLMVVATIDGWIEITKNGLNCVAIDQEPIHNYAPWRITFFLSFLLIIGFCVVEMFAGVIVSNCRHVKGRFVREGDAAALNLITKPGKELEILSSRLSKRRRALRDIDEPTLRRSLVIWTDYSQWRRKIFQICNHFYFDVAISLVIVANILVMAIEHYNMSRELLLATKILDNLFTAIFTLEVVLKVVAFGLREYFRSKWNRLDFVVAILALANAILEEIETSFKIPFIEPSIIRAIRIIRVIRALKLLKVAKGVQSLLVTLQHTLPHIGNMGLLFLLTFFIYASMGVELFGRLSCPRNNCEGISRHANFHNFGMAMLALFRVATGDNWKVIMEDAIDLANGPGAKCFSNGDDIENDCGLVAALAPFYFTSFFIIAQFFLVNVVIACLMHRLEETERQDLLNQEIQELRDSCKKRAKMSSENGAPNGNDRS